ncbi:hypothetical protein SAMN05216327_10251 [Dyadobacter sp. SG02]|uniref:hypothetical protein n=1 Tax=Dyadobacter sp. SG02 TaxID=1855291 RepID=UPI0008B6B174|nr:hypothetical protein [Dyadobacter sp. SG02]SEI49933.1 hypothetical protein SAMN05216327_10251 [Dyadobacter sp. SG02]
MTTLPYIFRKYKGFNPNEIKCWSPSSGIDPTGFDPEDIAVSRSSSKAGTSIPSPFARLELFDTAFNIIASDRGNLEGTSIYHQLVSDCLDVFQLLFNSKNTDIGFGKKLWFKEWKAGENIEKLKAKGEAHPHNLLARSLEQIFGDKETDRFSDTDSIFLIFYENKLLGGTSPFTLFFTSPNWSRFLKDRLISPHPGTSDGVPFFSDEYRPLHRRDPEFVDYVCKLATQYRYGFTKASSFSKYVNKTIREIEKKESGYQYKFLDYQDAARMPIDGEYDWLKTNLDGKFLMVNEVFFFQQKEEKEKIKIRRVSDFLISTTNTTYQKQVNHQNEPVTVEAPLVLVEGMNIPGDYIEAGVPWNSSTKIPDFLHRGVPLYERKLPLGNTGSEIKYPFVTVSDFLEDYLIEMPFNINAGKFFTGFNGDFKYLLPVKKEYFNFFKLEELKTQLSITMQDGVVSVDLRVPIQNRRAVRDIVFSKKYSKAAKTIVECRAGLGIYPFYQVTGSDPKLTGLNDYTVLLAERNEKQKLDALRFFSYQNFASDAHALSATVQERSTAADIGSGNSTSSSLFFRIRSLFDYMEISYTDNSFIESTGLIIPDFTGRVFSSENLTRAFTFAIDFGTSNTHLAFMQNGEALPKPFTITEADQQMVLLNAPGADQDPVTKFGFYGQFPAIDLTIRREFVPPVILQGKNAISAPFKTATCEIANFNNVEKSSVSLFSHINIGYYIDQEEKNLDGKTAANINYTTNLKWLLENNNDDSNKSRVRLFLTQLLTHIRAKALLNLGKPADLKVVWSVPLSMERGNKAALKAILRDAFKEVFGESGAQLFDPVPESVAPYFFLIKSDADIQETANVVNVDIGGGTTDVMMFMEAAGNREDRYMTTSFRFAGSDIWGNGYKSKLKDNGFIKNYQVYQKNNNINPTELKYFMKAVDDANLNADDIISLLFKYDNFRFADSIVMGNPDLLIVLYLHYAAIVYHLAQLIEIRDYPLPRYLSFTGKGSQYIRLLCGGDPAELEAFTKSLIRAYTSKTLQSSFRIHLNANPKEITANGSILYALSSDEEKGRYNENIDFVHPGFATDSELGARLASRENPFLIGETVKIDSAVNVAVLENLNSFLTKTLANNEIVRFLRDFKVNGLKEALAALAWNRDIYNGEGLIYDSYKKVLQDLHKQDKETTLPESLFFYALKDALYRLSKTINDSKS